MSAEDDSARGGDPLTELFHAASAVPTEERRAFVERACVHDPDLLAKVLPLLGLVDIQADGDPSALETRAVRAAMEAIAAPQGLVGRRIEDFELRELLGTGGMGVVYLGARVAGGFEQRAAVKLLPMGMDTPVARWRFHQERRHLAALSHPAIAQIYGGGVTEDGTPYLIMEHIDGAPLTRHCDASRLTVDERLRLFLTVCGAVQHAHEHLIVHRDLKPSNILVTRDGLPKLLDFGIARALDEDRRAPPGEVTRLGPAYTVAYSSPEQIRGEELTTASDVFSLGVVLFELLSGRRPFGEGRERELDEMLRDFVAVEPSPAHARSASPADLRRLLRGDLTRIVGTALREDPRERYPTPSALAEDIRRFLERRPVRATPPTLRYRLGRLLARRPAELALGGLIVFFIVYSLGQTLQARFDARRARALNEFVASLIVTLGSVPEATAAAALADALDSASASLEGQPMRPRAAHLDALGVLGGAYLALGRPERARPMLQTALGAGSGSRPDSASAMLHHQLALAHLDLDRPDSARAHLLIAADRYPTGTAALADQRANLVALLDSLDGEDDIR